MISWTVIDELFLVNICPAYWMFLPCLLRQQKTNVIQMIFPLTKSCDELDVQQQTFPPLFRTCVATCPNFMIFHLQTTEMIKINEATLCLNEANQYFAPDGHQLLSVARWQVKEAVGPDHQRSACRLPPAQQSTKLIIFVWHAQRSFQMSRDQHNICLLTAIDSSSSG